MSFNRIDLNNWKRKTFYDHYMNQVRCTYSLTLNIEVQGLVEKIKSMALIKTYPVQIYMISKAVNSFSEFRMSLDGEGQLGYWDICHPSYTIFNKETETFSSIYTLFEPDFFKFHQKCTEDIETYGGSVTLFPQRDRPENLFNISSLPWLDFTAFNLNVSGEVAYLPPIFTIGRYHILSGKTYMPLAIEVHHAVCDGYHVGKFVEVLRNMAGSYDEWLR